MIDITEATPDSSLNFAMNLCKGIGYIVIGNLYDNIRLPKKLTFGLLLILSVCTLMVKIVIYIIISIECSSRSI